MEIKFESSFEKDLRKIKDKKILSQLKQIIMKSKNIDNITEMKNLKKLKSYDTFYRIRLGNYRIGIEITDNILIFTRFLHRKDIYKFFP